MIDHNDDFRKANDAVINAIGALEAQRSECLTMAVKALEEIADADKGSMAHDLRELAVRALMRIAGRATR